MRPSTLALLLTGAFLTAATAGAQEVLRQTGRLERQDATLADGRYVDWHRFSLTAGTRYLFSVEADGIDPYLILRFADGATLENDDIDGWSAGLFYHAGRADALEIGVTTSSDPDLGEYDLVIRRVAAARPLQIGQTVTGSLASEPGGPGWRLDSYLVSGARGEVVRVRLTSRVFDPILKLQSRTGFVEESNESDEAAERTTYLFVDAGQIEIQVRATEVDDGGAYELALDRGGTARIIEPGRFLTGRLAEDPEAFILEGRRGQTYVIEATSSGGGDLDTTLTVVDRRGGRAYNDDNGEGTDSRLHYRFAYDGPVGITVGRLGEGTPSAYRLLVGPSDQAADTGPGPGGMLEDGVPVHGYLGTDERVGSRYQQRYTFVANENELIRLSLESDDFDALLKVSGPEGFQEEDDDGLADLDSLLQFVCPSQGSYTVIVSSAVDWGVGFYDLTFEHGDEVAALLDTAGHLEPRDPRDPAGRHFDVHSIEVNEGGGLTVDLTSDDFDAYLYVWEPQGQEIHSDDDGGGDTSARVRLNDVAGGTWTIYATSNGAGETGAYRLRVQGY